ncbi:hypothetical protein DYB28_001228 [Aphanomyces astaci]|uniref:Uncharacterized protein n=1 Tax=Aphanomyces astaci TaxID=112090 RepID=A0A397BUB3_APHAT|nr:hypothetical protein DYB25_007571 [Aphanomyces astaci]RHY42122.1 hypothetical protein DYB34_012160 [Aphanomyces astaci]RHY56759.1 hypothetical protein DYB30_005463 [Aphanomyces astaci]RHY58285.1 hypothetical protein DYB38_006593 [Aphanomyces astaci]RHY93018.1 hypothetical protein DYB31_001759 [Aphanomyces astaci]
MEELDAVALRALQAQEVATLRQGHALDNHLNNVETATRTNRTDADAAAWADLEAQHSIEGEAMRLRWTQRKNDFEEQKQGEMQALMAKHHRTHKAIQDSESLDETSMTKRHVFEHDRLHRYLEREQERRCAQAQMTRDVLSCKQCYEDSTLSIKHDRQRETMRHKQSTAIYVLQQQKCDVSMPTFQHFA